MILRHGKFVSLNEITKVLLMIPETKKTFSSIALMLLFIICLCFGAEFIEGNEIENDMPSKSIIEVLKEHTDELMSIPGVVGTAEGLCDDQPCIKVFVIKNTPELEQKIPPVLEGFTVNVEETGEFRALPENND